MKATSRTRYQALEKLLLDLFTKAELCRHVRHGPDGISVMNSIDDGGDPIEVAHRVVGALRARGMLDLTFFADLRVERPGKVADVNKVYRLFDEEESGFPRATLPGEELFLGTWAGTWQGSSAQRDVQLRIEKAEVGLRGRMLIRYLRNNTMNIVEESGPFVISGRDFTLQCDGVRWIERTSGRAWRPDMFAGVLSADHRQITGTQEDDHGRRASFIFSRPE